jgi:uncharacterized membrane protein
MIDLLVISTLLGTAAIIIILGILVVWKIVKNRKSVLPVADERTRRVNGQAAYYALIVGVYFSLGLLWVVFLGPNFLGLPEIGAMPALITSILVYAVLYLSFRWYFNRKEDF